MSPLVLTDSSGILKLAAFFLRFSQPSYAFAVQSHRWLMQVVCSLQETLSVPYPACGCSVPLLLAPFPLGRWLFPLALPRVVVLGHKPAAQAAVLTSCFLLTKRCWERHRTGSIHQPLHTSCILTPSRTQTQCYCRLLNSCHTPPQAQLHLTDKFWNSYFSKSKCCRRGKILMASRGIITSLR